MFYIFFCQNIGKKPLAYTLTNTTRKIEFKTLKKINKDYE
ncbi:hypothetical protein TOREUM_20852 [Tenacibaculum litoreum]